jgi:hypothetical protein
MSTPWTGFSAFLLGRLSTAGGTLLTLAGPLVKFFHQGRVAIRWLGGGLQGPWLGKEKLTSGPRQEATASWGPWVGKEKLTRGYPP